MTEYIELNMSNYSEEDVSQLNEWGIEAVDRIEALTNAMREIRAHCDLASDGSSNRTYVHILASLAIEEARTES